MLSFIKEIDLGFKIPLPDSTIKVAVTGLSRSGKTVFMTSLINQLLANDKLNYLNEKLGKKFVARLLPPDSNYARFDYFSKLKAFRKKDPIWPEATKQVSKTTLQLEFKSDYAFLDNQIVNIELIDYPGEWLLDLSMLELSFKEWSKQTISLAKKDDKKEHSYEFFRVIDEYDLYSKSDESADEIIFDAYCEYLKILYYNHYSFMQPGRFLEPGDLDGDPLLHFAPLPTVKDGIEVDKDSIYARFQKRYDNYLKEVVKRLYIEHFKYFDTQIVLVDLIKTLQYGYYSFKDMNLAFKHILKSFTYGNNSFLSKLFGLKIDHVIFAATKADFIPRVQHESYKRVLTELIGKIKNELDVSHTDTEVTIFSAVKSTNYVKAKHNGEILECIEGVVEGEDKTSIHFPGVLPDDYKSEKFWSENSFDFPAFKPATFPQSDSEAVPHIRMDRLIYSILRKRV
jgi:predicted YcjX-like family ATPase